MPAARISAPTGSRRDSRRSVRKAAEDAAELAAMAATAAISAARSGRNAYVADRQEVGTIVEAASDATREACDGVHQAEPDFEAAEYSVHDDEDD